MTEVSSADSDSDDEEPNNKKLKMMDYTDDYKKLISLMVGCQYVSFQSQTSEIIFKSKSEKIKETTLKVTGPVQTSPAPIKLPDECVKLQDLPGKPLGDIRRKESKSNIKYFILTVKTKFFKILQFRFILT